MIAWEKDSAFFYNNDVIQYELATNKYSAVKTEGAIPTPRKGFAIERLGKIVFIHGGWCNKRLNDFYALHLEKMQWTRLETTGFVCGIRDHSLVKVSEKEIMLVGGELDFGVSNKVALFDIDELEWKEVLSLPEDMTGADGGMHRHQTIHVQVVHGVFVYCIGGYVDSQMENHPSHLTLVEIKCE